MDSIITDAQKTINDGFQLMSQISPCPKVDLKIMRSELKRLRNDDDDTSSILSADL